MKRMILLIAITAAALGISDPQPARAHESYKHAPQATQQITKHGVIQKSHYRRHQRPRLRQWRHRHPRFRNWGYRHPRFHRPRYYRPRHRGYAPRGYWYGGYYYPPVGAVFSLRYNGYRHPY